MKITKKVLKNGQTRYFAMTYIGKDVITGKDVKPGITGKSEKDVWEKYFAKKKEFEKNGYTVIKKANVSTINALLDEWVITKNNTMKPHSYDQMIFLIDKHIRPIFGDILTDRISHQLLQIKVNEYTKTAGIKKYKLPLNYLRNALKHAVMLGVIASDPFDRIIIPTLQQDDEKKIRFYSVDEILLIQNALAAVDKNEFYPYYITVLLNTGMRASELLAVQWSDVDLENGVIKDIKNLVLNTDTVLSAKTKSSSRTVFLNDEAIRALREWKIVQFNQASSIGMKRPLAVAWKVSENRYYRLRMLRYHFENLANNQGFPYLDGLHCLRHTFATHWLANGGDSNALKEQLGHSKINMTLDIYGHVLDSVKRKAVKNVFSIPKSG